jgi:two-component system LytT family sensor kinase
VSAQARRRTVVWAAFFLLFTGIAALEFSYRYLDDLARGHSGTLVTRLIEEGTGAYTAFALFPLIIALARRFPWRAATWPRTLAVQAGGLVLYTLAHTTLMALTRSILFPLAGLGHYDYGIMVYRYPMEASIDAVYYALIVALIYFYFRVRDAQRREVAAARLEAEVERLRLDNLRLQLQPHFLFNTLNAISAVMYEDPKAADTMIARLSDFLRLTLETADTHETRLDEELRLTALYVDVMRGRLEHRLVFRSRCDDGLGAALVPSMLLQPLVENAIVHGTAGVRDHLDISIAARRDGDALVIRIDDDGVGPARDAVSDGRGLGNTRSRIAHTGNGASSLQIAARPEGGTAVELRLPYRVA